MHILPLSSFYKTQNLGWYGINKWLNQREEISFLKESIEVQVEKYRRQKVEYRGTKGSSINETREILTK